MMLSEQSDPKFHAAFPSVHAFIMLEGTMNLTGETQPLVEQLMMIKRMQVDIYRRKKMHPYSSTFSRTRVCFF